MFISDGQEIWLILIMISASANQHIIKYVEPYWKIEENYLGMGGREMAMDRNWLSSSTKSSWIESGRGAIAKSTSFSSPSITRCSSVATPSSSSTSASSSGILYRKWDLKNKI